MVLTFILAAVAALSFGLTVWQWNAARRFPLHQRTVNTSFTPAVTVLKPLKGCDAETERCLRSWFLLEYRGAVQLLFGVASAQDPVCALVDKLIAAHPGKDAKLVICSEQLGPNAKVSTLVQLQRHARYEVLVVSDADVLVTPDLLAYLAAPLQDREVGLVNCFYALANPTTLAMHWEAVAINADFWSQVLQAQELRGLDFALGAVMATTRSRVERLGGFAALLDYLADDYQLGSKIAAQGARIVLSPIVVECWSAPMSWKEVWTHQLRWSRTIRACQPGPFFLSILSNATLWPLVWWLVDRTALALSAFLLCAAVRVWTAQGHQRRLSRRGVSWALGWLVLFKDLVGAAIWAAAFAGNRVRWKGSSFRMLSNGKLQAI